MAREAPGSDFLPTRWESWVRGTETYREIKTPMMKGWEEWVMESQPELGGYR